MAQDPVPDSTRRAVLKSVGAALGVGAVGSAAGHPGGYDKGTSVDGTGGEPFGLDDGEPFRNAAAYGYHSIGSTGRSSLNGQKGQRHGGDRNAEVRCHGDIAVTCFRASDDEDAGRRMAVLDISEFNDAETEAELDEAELSVTGILHNVNAEANMATDVKLSDDGEYAFLGTQALYPGPIRDGSNGSTEFTDPRSTPEATGGVVAVDISDRGNPRTIDSVTGAFSTGIHNVFHHRIDGTEYVFACKDAGLISPDSGVYVLRFDREPGKLTLVNRWSADGNATRGGVGTQHGLSYVHDIEIQDDPRTGRPTAYVADWDRGMRVLDVSDPTNIQHVGQFDMNQSHFAAPFPELVEDADGNMRRVAVASHEEPDERFDQRFDTVNNELYNTPHTNKTNPNSTGTVFLVDCEGIYPEDSLCGCGHEGEPKQLGELANWTWKNADTGEGFDDDTTRTERLDAIEQNSFSFQFSPHNSQPAVREVDGENRHIIHQGHYHGGVRYLEVEPGSADGLTGDARRDYRPRTNPNAAGRDGSETIGWINHDTDWNVTDIGHARPANRETGNLSPDFWSSVEHNGLSYHGDRGAGVYVTKHTDLPMTSPLPPLEADRADDGSAFLAGQTNRVEITVETFDRPNGDAAAVHVRDRMPGGYEVVGGDDVETYQEGNRTAVEFTATVDPGDSATLTYFVEVPSDPGSGTFGPVEVSADGDEWRAEAGTTDSNLESGFNV